MLKEPFNWWTRKPSQKMMPHAIVKAVMRKITIGEVREEDSIASVTGLKALTKRTLRSDLQVPVGNPVERSCFTLAAMKDSEVTRSYMSEPTRWEQPWSYTPTWDRACVNVDVSLFQCHSHSTWSLLGELKTHHAYKTVASKDIWLTSVWLCQPLASAKCSGKHWSQWKVSPPVHHPERERKTLSKKNSIAPTTGSSICLSFSRAEGNSSLSPAARIQQTAVEHHATWTDTLPGTFVWSPIAVTGNFQNHQVTVVVVQPMLWPKCQLQTVVCATKQIPCKVLQAIECMKSWFGHPLGQRSNGELTIWKISSNIEQSTYCRPVDASLSSVQLRCAIIGIKLRMGWCLLWLKVPPDIQ